MTIFEKNPYFNEKTNDLWNYEIIDKKCKPLGQALADYLPKSLSELSLNVSTDKGTNRGFTISAKPTDKPTNKSAEEIIAHIKEKCNTPGLKFVSYTEMRFQTVVCTFLKQDKHYFTERNLVLTLQLNGFKIPEVRYLFFNRKGMEVNPAAFVPTWLDFSEYSIARVYSCENDIEYYTAVLLELVRQKRYLNQCELCGRWFVVQSRADEIYCQRQSELYRGKTCQQAGNYIAKIKREKNSPLFKARKDAYNRCRNRGLLDVGEERQNTESETNVYKFWKEKWESEFEQGKITEDELIERYNQLGRKGGIIDVND